MSLISSQSEPMPRKSQLTKDAADALKEVSAAAFGSRFTTNLFRLFILASVSVVVFYGRVMFNSLVDESPTIIKTVAAGIQNQTDVSAVKADVVAVRNEDSAIQSRINQLSDAQTRVFDALKTTNTALQGIITAQAVTNEHMAGIEKTLDRVETKQDQASK